MIKIAELAGLLDATWSSDAQVYPGKSPDPEMIKYLATLRIHETARDAGELIGYCACHRPVNGAAEMAILAVAPNHQRRGLATQLVTGIEQNLRSQSVKQVGARILSSNQPSLSLFTRLGYVPAPVKPHVANELFLSRDLTAEADLR